MTCAHCIDAADVFGQGTTRFEELRYRWFGPSSPTKRLVREVASRVDGPFSLLDVGGGIGVIPDRLSDRLESVTGVEASPAHLMAARLRASRAGYADRMTTLEGDFVELADAVPSHDAVTLDRVVCCYPDMPALVAATAERADRVLGLVIPTVGIVNRIAFPLANAWMRLRGSAFRIFLHSPDAVDSVAATHGLRRVAVRRGLLWQVRIYVRDAA